MINELEKLVTGSILRTGSYCATVLTARHLMMMNATAGDRLTTPRYTSIIIPAYNEERYIQRALDSLLSQNMITKYPEYFEIIVVDNGSIDNTKQIASQYPVKVISENARGKLYAKDTGIRCAKGEIIISCDADSQYMPNYLAAILSSFNNDNKVVAVCGINFLDGIGVLLPTSAFGIRMPYLIGSNNAFLKKYYNNVAFDLGINQFSMKEMAEEEEKQFASRLYNYGKVIHNWRAINIASCRRWFSFQDIKFTNEIKSGQRFAKLNPLCFKKEEL